VKRLDRGVEFLTLSALDTLATAIGVFVLLVAFLMPYYQNTFDLESTIEAARATQETTAAQLDDVKERIAEESERAAAALAQTEQISAKLASLAVRPTPRPTAQPPTPSGATVKALDLVFVVDTTASMGQVLEQMTRSMASIVRILERLSSSVRVGVVAYRDYDTEPPLIRALGLTETREALPQIIDFVASLRVSRVSSHDIEEAVYSGIRTATAMPFPANARQAIIVIGDAAAHPWELAECLAHVERFVDSAPGRTVSGLFASTLSSQRLGDRDRAFFVRVAEAGRGSFTDHAASMTESILLSVLVQ
jgi:hypothetical protein